MSTAAGFAADATLDELELAYLEPETDPSAVDPAEVFPNWHAVAPEGNDLNVALRGWLELYRQRDASDTIGPSEWLERLELSKVHPSKRVIAKAFIESGRFADHGEQGRALSKSKLAEESGKGTASVERFLRWAKESGWIRPTGHVVRFHQGQRATPIYALTTPDMATCGEPVPEGWEVIDWHGHQEQSGIPAFELNHDPQGFGLEANLDDLEK